MNKGCKKNPLKGHANFLLRLLILRASFCWIASADQEIAKAQTSNGIVHGTVLPGVHEFLGMKFATAKRFEPPVAFTGSYPQQPFMATDFGSACLQVGNSADLVYGSEDCLFANVWKPSDAKLGSPGLPVVVFIYGGSNQFGETEPYNGSAFALRQNAVYASIAYRTGPIGWMAFEEDERATRSTGTWGSLDQQAGLRWIQQEIHNFGGDPSRVIIHGQSSGAMNVELHLVMPGSKGLVRGFASESGGLAASSLASGIANSVAVGKLANCSGGASLKKCLQEVDPLVITGQTYNLAWGPHVDKVTIPAPPMEMLQAGSINNMSVIIGSQTNDSNKGLVEYNMTVKEYEAAVVEQVGIKFLRDALHLYPPSSENLVQNVHTLGSVSSDAMLCDIRRRVDLVNRYNPGMAFMYRFNYWYQSNPRCTAEPNYHDNITGPKHEDEVTFVMGQPIFMFDGSCCGKWGRRLRKEPCKQLAECLDCWDPSLGEGYHAYFDDKEWAFSQLVGSYWANLARYGTPNPAGREDWPVFTKEERVWKNIVLDANLPKQHQQELSLYGRKDICLFWDRVTSMKLRGKEDADIMTV